MTQHWRRLGRIFLAEQQSDWLYSHATYPTALPLANGLVRVFFCPRDKQNRSHVTSLDLVVDGDSWSIERMPAAKSLIQPGARGAFDDSGVTVGSLVSVEKGLCLYYLGWNVRGTVPFTNAIGLATGDPEGDAFTKASPAPILDRNRTDPFCLGYPWVRKEEQGWRMWYGTHLEWGPQGLEMIHVIRQAASADGVHWRPEAEPDIPVAGGDEWAVSRPTILKDGDLYRMWFARRFDQYRLGYAESADGSHWARKDEDVRFAPSQEDWDSDAVTYPCVFRHQGAVYMLYNGNRYGATGFGLARLDEEKE